MYLAQGMTRKKSASCIFCGRPLSVGCVLLNLTCLMYCLGVKFRVRSGGFVTCSLPFGASEIWVLGVDRSLVAEVGPSSWELVRRGIPQQGYSSI